MSNLLSLGKSFTEVALKKVERLKERALGSEKGAALQVVDERVDSRDLVIEDVPARVLVASEWMSIDIVDISVKGFAFEVDRIMGARFNCGQKLVFTLRIPELREFSLYGRIQWKKPHDDGAQIRCGVEIIEVHGPGGGISVRELLKFLAERQPKHHGIPRILKAAA